MPYRWITRRRYWGVRGLGQDLEGDTGAVQPGDQTWGSPGGVYGPTIPVDMTTAPVTPGASYSGMGPCPAGYVSGDFGGCVPGVSLPSSQAFPQPAPVSGGAAPGGGLTPAQALLISQGLKTTGQLATIAMQSPGQFTQVDPITGKITTSYGVPGAVPAAPGGTSVSAAFAGFPSSYLWIGALIIGGVLIMGRRR